MNREKFCRAANSDGQQICDCEEFYPQTGDEGHCAECGHGRSKHPGTRKAAEVESSEIAQDEEVPGSSGAATVKEIFTRVTSAKASTTGSKRGGSILSAKAARDEALSTLSSTRLAGYNKLSKGPGPSTGLQKVMHHYCQFSSSAYSSFALDSKGYY